RRRSSGQPPYCPPSGLTQHPAPGGAPREDAMTKKRIREFIFGKAKDPNDPSVHHGITLIAFLAWVGLGADGLSSACYGPEATFKALGEHRHLAPFLAL